MMSQDRESEKSGSDVRTADVTQMEGGQKELRQ